MGARKLGTLLKVYIYVIVESKEETTYKLPSSTTSEYGRYVESLREPVTGNQAEPRWTWLDSVR